MLVIDVRKAMDAGIGTYIRQLVPRVCSELSDINCELLVSKEALSWADQFQKENKSNVSIVHFDAAPFSFAEQILFRKNLKKNSLLWATSLSHPLFYTGRYVATVHDVAQLALPRTMAGGLLTKLASKVFFESIRKNAQELIFVSDFSRREFTHHVGKPVQNTSVIHLGVDSKWFDISKNAKAINITPYFISVSSIRPHKNFTFLLKAFLRVANAIPHSLIIVGDKRGLTDLEPRLMEEISNLGSRVQFLGRINDDELREWVANAHAMIFPSLYEGFGLPPIEAMAAGCPVISSSCAATQEVCGSAAIFFNPYEIHSLIDAILKFSLTTTIEREKMAKIGRIKALTYNWSVAAHSTAKILRKSHDDLRLNGF